MPPVQTQIGAWIVNGTSKPLPVFTARADMKVRLTLETAGPCEISTRADATPISLGKGQPLLTDVEKIFVLSAGSILYITSDTTQRVGYITEPTPFAEVFAMKIDALFNAVRSFFQKTPTKMSGKDGC